MAKAKRKRDEEREYRITMEIVVDAYGAEEQAMGWYCYLEGQLQFPFIATCDARREISPLKAKDKFVVVGMPDEEECRREMFVTIRRENDEWAVPLAQLTAADSASAETKQAVEDWRYWVRMGYTFG